MRSRHSGRVQTDIYLDISGTIIGLSIYHPHRATGKFYRWASKTSCPGTDIYSSALVQEIQKVSLKPQVFPLQEYRNWPFSTKGSASFLGGFFFFFFETCRWFLQIYNGNELRTNVARTYFKRTLIKIEISDARTIFSSIWAKEHRVALHAQAPEGRHGLTVALDHGTSRRREIAKNYSKRYSIPNGRYMWRPGLTPMSS